MESIALIDLDRRPKPEEENKPGRTRAAASADASEQAAEDQPQTGEAAAHEPTSLSASALQSTPSQTSPSFLAYAVAESAAYIVIWN